MSRYGGGWAVVTGASDGLGLGYSKALAELGFNVLMVSRNADKLKQAAKEVELMNPTAQIKIFEFNLNRHYSEESYKPLLNAIDELKDVSMLINNVGYRHGLQQIYHEFDTDQLASTFQLN